MDIQEHVTAELTKASPALGVASLTLFGYPVSDAVSVATLVYIIVQIAYTVGKWVKSNGQPKE